MSDFLGNSASTIGTQTANESESKPNTWPREQHPQLAELNGYMLPSPLSTFPFMPQIMLHPALIPQHQMYQHSNSSLYSKQELSSVHSPNPSLQTSSTPLEVVQFDRDEAQKILLRQRQKAREEHLSKIAELEAAEIEMRDKEQQMVQELAKKARQQRVKQTVAALVM